MLLGKYGYGARSSKEDIVRFSPLFFPFVYDREHLKGA